MSHRPVEKSQDTTGTSPGISSRLLAELKELLLVGLYFGCWLAALLLLKQLVLEEYHIEFQRWSMALVGALILSKTVLVLELVPLGSWIGRQPAWVDVLIRTILYTLGVALVLLLEKGFEGRHEYGGFAESLEQVLNHAEIHHVWVNTLCVGGAILSFNILSIIKGHLGEGGIAALFLRPPPHTR